VSNHRFARTSAGVALAIGGLVGGLAGGVIGGVVGARVAEKPPAVGQTGPRGPQGAAGASSNLGNLTVNAGYLCPAYSSSILRDSLGGTIEVNGVGVGECYFPQPSAGTTTTSVAPVSTTLAPPVSYTTFPPPRAGTPATFQPGVPSGLAEALTKYFSNPSNAVIPLGELVFSAKVDPEAQNWAVYEVQGTPKYSSQIQPAGALAHSNGGIWTIYSILGPGCNYNHKVPTQVAAFFKLRLCSN
jgi:hypothetical protein